MSVESGYDTPAYTVGTTPATNSSVTLNAGDVIADGSNLYRYVGTSGTAFDLTTDSKITTDTTDFKQIGGAGGQTYVYIGAAKSSVDLHNANYADPTQWRLATAYSAAPAAGVVNNEQTLYYGDTVSVGAGYDDPDYTVWTRAAPRRN